MKFKSAFEKNICKRPVEDTVLTQVVSKDTGLVQIYESSKGILNQT